MQLSSSSTAVSSTALHFRAERLSVQRGERVLMEGVSFSLQAGQALHIKGANGAGKTSLLRVLTGLVEPAEGSLYWRELPLAKGYAEFCQQLLFIGHRAAVKPELTVAENLRFYCQLRGVALESTALEQALEAVSLWEYEDEPVAHLSAGQARRVALARLLLEPADLWLLDEPLAALDASGQAWLADCFNQHLARNGAVIFTSHQPVPGLANPQTLEMV